MNLFGVADMQLTRGKIVIYSLHHLQHVFSEGHPLIPLRVSYLCVLHLSGKYFHENLDPRTCTYCTHKFMVMFNEVIIT